jgi:hypothetical protein
MRFALHNSLGVTDEVVQLEKVLGFDLNLTVRKKGSKEHRRFVKSMEMKNPLLRRAIESASRESLKGASGAAAQAIAQKFEEEFATAMDSSSMGQADLEYVMTYRLEEAVALVAGWSGEAVLDLDTKRPAPCTWQNVRELLSDPMPLPEGHEKAGQELGDALVHAIHDAAEKGAILRVAAVVDGGKGSGTTSAGSSERGPEIPNPGVPPSHDELSAAVSPI